MWSFLVNNLRIIIKIKETAFTKTYSDNYDNEDNDKDSSTARTGNNDDLHGHVLLHLLLTLLLVI